MWYIVLHPKPDAKKGTTEINHEYANVKQDRWVSYRRVATYWFKKEKAEAVAASAVMRKPEYIGRVEVMNFPFPGHR